MKYVIGLILMSGSFFQAERGLDPGEALPTVVTRASDDLAAWQSLDALAPRDPGAPSWLSNAADSKPWAQYFAGFGFKGRQPGPGGHLVGYSEHFEPTPELAQSTARESVIRQLVTLSLWQIMKPQEDALLGEGDLEQLSKAIAGEHRRELTTRVREWYDQSVQIHGEPVYRSAVLVEAPTPDKLQSVARQAFQSAHEWRLQRRRAILFRAGLLVAGAIGVLGVHAAANAASRGHYAGSLRILSALAYVALAFWIVMA